MVLEKGLFYFYSKGHEFHTNSFHLFPIKEPLCCPDSEKTSMAISAVGVQLLTCVVGNPGNI